MVNMKYTPQGVGKIIRKEREILSLSQDEFLEIHGEKLGIKSRQALSKWEAGNFKSDFSVWALLELCNIFHCDPGYLLCEYDQKTREITDIVEATGLSPAAVNAIQQDSNNPRIANIISGIIEDKDFYWVPLNLSCAFEASIASKNYDEKAFGRYPSPINGAVVLRPDMAVHYHIREAQTVISECLGSYMDNELLKENMISELIDKEDE